MKEKFTQEEWQHIKLLPFQIFVLVAGADGRIDKDEVAQLQKDLKDAPFYKDPLHKELFIDILSSDIGSLIREVGDVSKLKERASKIKDVLKTRLTPEEYQNFLKSIFINGIKVARASGGGLFGKGNKISEEETNALTLIAAIFEIDLGKL